MIGLRAPSLARPRTVIVVLTVLALVVGTHAPTRGQSSLRLVDANTQVRAIDFVGNETFDRQLLAQQIATAAPNFLDLVTFWRESSHPFRPIELQKDVARLRRFYARHGFLHTRVDYVVNYDRERNSVHVVFTVREGPPVLLGDVTFTGPDGRPAFYQFPADEQSEWVALRTRIVDEAGRRFEDFYRQQLENEIRSWLENRGYAFPQISSDTSITHFHDRLEPTSGEDALDLDVQVDAGPKGRVDEIRISGNQSISRELILKAVPLRIGDLFRRSDLVDAQRQLFSMNLFRMAIADLPPQDRDSTVAVRIRLREAEPRYLSAQTGYSFTRGMNLEGQWTHRNLFGNARSLTLSGLWSTGLGAIRQADKLVPSRWRLTASMRQPYLWVPGLSIALSPFYERRFEPAFQIEQFGLNTTFLYDFHRFRTLSLRHSLTRNLQLDTEDVLNGSFYNKSILNLSGTFGRADDYFDPTNGFLIQPYLELAGQMLASDVNYLKGGVEATWYQPFGDETGTAVRLFVGQLEPLETVRGPVDSVRFRDIRFYAGGPSDVRGWGTQLLGPKRPAEDGSQYIPIGGRSKVSGNLELRLPFPGLSDSWGTTAFLDFGQVREHGPSFDPASYRYGAGAGLRYQTPVGPFRLDVAYKLNPSRLDVRPPVPPGQPLPEPSFFRRTALYLTIGNPF